MLTFSQGWRSFKEGLNRRYILEYWSTLWNHAWEIWWGAGVVGVICTFFTIYYAPSGWLLGWVVAWLFLVAGYFIWHADHVRLEKKIDITRVRAQEWTIPQGSVRAGHHARAYYFEVVNRSEGVTIEGVSVQLKSMSPEVPNLNWLPINLHVKHDNPIRAEDQMRSFDLNPCEPKNIDFVSALEGDTMFSIVHVVTGANHTVPFDTDGHRLQVMVTAKDMPISLIWFKVWRDDAGLLMCDIEK